MHYRNAFRRKAQSHLGHHNIVVNQSRAVTYLDKNILADHAVGRANRSLGHKIVVEQILGDPRSLGLPVAPDPHGAVVDMVSPEDHVNGCMQLDGGNLSAAQLHHVVDMMNVVILDNAEHTAHTPHDSGLLTMMDVAAPNDMAAYFFFEPSMILPTADSIPLHLCRAFHMLIEIGRAHV